MKYLVSLFIAGFALSACNSGSTVTKPELATEIDSFSYYYGVLVGQDIKTNVVQSVGDANLDAVKYGIVAAFDGEIEEDRTYMEQYVERVFKRESGKKNKERRQQQATEAQLRLEQYRKDVDNYAESINDLEAWIKKNRDFGQVVKAPEGYFYREVKAGDGPKPTITDEVEVHYTGTLLNGSKFDSSIDRGQPATFPLLQVIPGWTLGLQNIPVGSTYELFIPAHLAYGDRDSETIPANSALVFEVQLLSIVQ